jgi:hypothetical protein
LQAAGCSFDFVSLFESACRDSFLEGNETFEEAFLGSRDHGDFFFAALCAAAEGQLAVRVVGIGDFEHFGLLVGAATGEC